MNRLDDTSAFVIPADQLLLTRRGKTRMYTVGIIFERIIYSAPLRNSPLDVNGVLKLLKKLDPKKANGPDEISTYIFLRNVRKRSPQS